MTTSPTTDIQPGLLPVIQADRDAAQTLWKAMQAQGPVVTAEGGRAIGHAMLQAFARHRLTSTTPTLGDMVMVPRADLQLLADLKKHIHEHEPDRVRWAGEWYYGPLATAYITTIEAVAEAAEAMIAAAPASPIPTSANEGEREATARNVYLLQGDNQRMAEALRACRDQFTFYAREHEAAGKTEKAATNTRFAKIVTDALEAVKPALSPALDNTSVEGQEAISDAVHSALWKVDAENERLRTALTRIEQFVRDFRSPWGSWKTAWWEGEVSDDAAFTEDNAMMHVANIASAALTVQTEKAR